MLISNGCGELELWLHGCQNALNISVRKQDSEQVYLEGKKLPIYKCSSKYTAHCPAWKAVHLGAVPWHA